MTYRLIDPATSERLEFRYFAELINRWFAEPRLIVVTLGMTDTETAAVNNIYELRRQLLATKQELKSATSLLEIRGATIRRITDREGDVV